MHREEHRLGLRGGGGKITCIELEQSLNLTLPNLVRVRKWGQVECGSDAHYL